MGERHLLKELERWRAEVSMDASGLTLSPSGRPCDLDMENKHLIISATTT